MLNLLPLLLATGGKPRVCCLTVHLLHHHTYVRAGQGVSGHVYRFPLAACRFEAVNLQ